MSVNNEEMVVTPWEVAGKIDYDKLIREFGTQPLTPEILDTIRKQTGELHPQLAADEFSSHTGIWIGFCKGMKPERNWYSTQGGALLGRSI